MPDQTDALKICNDQEYHATSCWCTNISTQLHSDTWFIGDKKTHQPKEIWTLRSHCFSLNYDMTGWFSLPPERWCGWVDRDAPCLTTNELAQLHKVHVLGPHLQKWLATLTSHDSVFRRMVSLWSLTHSPQCQKHTWSPDVNMYKATIL